jgi:VanZ family protein
VRRLLLLSLALIVYGSLYPWHFDFAQATPLAAFLHSWPKRWTRWDFRDAVLNVLLYAPLGMAAVLLLQRRMPRWPAVLVATLAGAALSVTMELTQLFVPGRDSSLFDVLTNTAGTTAGAVAGTLFGARLVALIKPRAHRHAAGAGILLACWLGYQLYPLFPVITHSRLHAALDLLLYSHGVTVVEISLFAAEWFAAALAAEALLGQLPTLWLAAGMLCLPLRAFVPTRTISLNEVLGAALALAAWALISPRFRRTIGPWFLISAIVAAQLAPFRFVSAPARFYWMPFAGSFGYERWAALVTLLGKVFAYGAAVWLLARGRRGYLQTGVLVATALFALEWAQRYIPGRTPEITDPLLALLMAFALRAARDLAARRGLG